MCSTVRPIATVDVLPTPRANETGPFVGGLVTALRWVARCSKYTGLAMLGYLAYALMLMLPGLAFGRDDLLIPIGSSFYVGILVIALWVVTAPLGFVIGFIVGASRKRRATQRSTP